uniref:Ferrochelatase-2, chloroplastic n=1 Tax=Vitis vinifera TaxID=29760 RepID=A5AKE8_VITVI|nr:hypothetical protein VITISV_030894 [Vitis vinifera]
MKIKNLAHKLHVNLLRTRDICHGQRRIDTDQFKLNDNCQKVDLYLEIIGLFPRAISTSQRICRCIGVQMDACVNSNLPKNSVVAKYSSGWSDIQSSNLKQSLNKYSLPLRALLTSKTQDVSSKPLVGDEKIGVLLLNLGGPETLEDVQPFLFNLFADPVRICSGAHQAHFGFNIPASSICHLFLHYLLSLPTLLSQLCTSALSCYVADLLRAEELKKSLCEKNVPAEVYVGMRYWHPFTEEAIEQVTGHILVVVHPHPSPIFTSFCRLPLALGMKGGAISHQNSLSLFGGESRNISILSIG